VTGALDTNSYITLSYVPALHTTAVPLIEPVPNSLVALVLSLIPATLGIVTLVWSNALTAATLALGSLLWYITIYTPMKHRSWVRAQHIVFTRAAVSIQLADTCMDLICCGSVEYSVRCHQRCPVPYCGLLRYLGLADVPCYLVIRRSHVLLAVLPRWGTALPN